MTTQKRRTLMFILVAAAPGILAIPAPAATMSASLTPPTVTGEDIANFGTVTGTDKWWPENNTGAGSVKGQTFTTGPIPVLLKAVTYQIASNQRAEPTKTYVIRLGTVSGTTFTQIHTETATQSFAWNASEYMTWTLGTPVLLASNTTYALDIGITNSTSAWQTGIPYINYTANDYPGGQRYSSGSNGIGTTNLIYVSNSDRIFHLRLQHPLAPSPENGANVRGGDVVLSWSNLSPNTGTNVWVDVWFGTNAGALSQEVSAGLNTNSHTVSAPVAGTYFWRIDSYLDGAPTGTPVAGPVFWFVVTDTDGDGLPDEYELAHTSPPSNTALNPDDDLEPDDLTNLQEFQIGTDPNNPDTDGDTLQDGAELAGVGLRPPTDPLLADTDGDGLEDGAESNTSTWVSDTNTGTNPTVADTDADGLEDGVETNTGAFAGSTDTGTSPLHPDSDGDGAGDWYEVTATGTDPTAAADKPNIPYPLPDPDDSTGATNKPVKVYILSGQSNMVGFGRKDGSDPGTLQTLTVRENKFPNLVMGTGAWATRNDVRYRGVISAFGNDLLRPGFGANGNSFGPELGFGHVMGWYHDEPVLVIKSSIGNRSILWDILPPDSPRFDYNGRTYAGYGESPNSWPIGGDPSPYVWYAGKQYDDFFLAEADMGPTGWASPVDYPADCQVRHNGVVYISRSAHTSGPDSEPGIGAQSATYWNVYSVFNVTDILDNWATEYPQWAEQGFEIAGFVWWQGFNDQSEPAASRYELNLTNIIHHLRAYYSARYPRNISPNAPFVLATIGFNGWSLSGSATNVANAQLAVGDPALHPEFAGNVKTMEARGYWRSVAESPSRQGHHYNHNAETYMLVGDALGRGMVELRGGAWVFQAAIAPARPGPGYNLTWNSRAGRLYNVYGRPDLAADISTWTLVETNLPATPSTNTLTISPSANSMFYLVEEVPVP